MIIWSQQHPHPVDQLDFPASLLQGQPLMAMSKGRLGTRWNFNGNKTTESQTISTLFPINVPLISSKQLGFIPSISTLLPINFPSFPHWFPILLLGLRSNIRSASPGSPASSPHSAVPIRARAPRKSMAEWSHHRWVNIFWQY